MDDYLSARLISTPFGLYDCDVPADASIAVIVSHIDTAKDLRHSPGTRRSGRHPDDRADRMGPVDDDPRTPGARSLRPPVDPDRLRPDDVDVALLYDGFSFNCLSWLEGLGFCGIGEAKDFLAGGTNIALEGGDGGAQPPRRPTLGRPHPRNGLRTRGRGATARRGRRSASDPTPAPRSSAAEDSARPEPYCYDEVDCSRQPSSHPSCICNVRSPPRQS